jgi:hypothetical protein
MHTRDVAATLGTTREVRFPLHTIYWWGEYGAACEVEATPDGIIERVRYSTGFPQEASFGKIRYGMSAAQLQRLAPFMEVPRTDLPPGVTYLASSQHPAYSCIAELRNGRLLGLRFESYDLESRRETATAAMRARNDAAVARERLARRWCTLSDPEAILDFWAAHPVDPSEAGAYRRYAAWLRGGSPDSWHEAATSWMWSRGVAPVVWVIRQPDCDLATPIELFLNNCGYAPRLAGSDRSAIPEDEREQYDLTIELRDRLRAGFYTRQEIAYDGVRAFEQNFGADAPALDEAVFKRKLEGRTIPEEYPCKDNGIPVAFRD